MSTGSAPSLSRRLAIVFACLAGLLVLVIVVAYVGINWYGEREWTAFRTEWEKKGEKFAPTDFIPASVPDDQNFATTPLLAAQLDYSRAPGKPVTWNNPALKDRAKDIGAVLQNRGKRKAPGTGQWPLAVPVDLIQWHQFLSPDAPATNVQESARGVLEVLKQFDVEFNELASAGARPHSVFRLEYDKGFQMLLPHLAGIRSISQTLRLRALAKLGAGDKDGAFADTKLCLRLADALRSEPLLISQLVRLAILQQAIQPIWEGVTQHQWSDSQLREIQRILAAEDILDAYLVAMRTERAFGNAAIDDLRSGRMSWSSLGDADGMSGGSGISFAGRFIPAGFFRLNQLTLNRVYQERCLPVFDVENRKVDVEKAMALDSAPELRESGLFNIFARMLLPAMSKSASKFAYGEASVDLATTACALERYRLKNGEYPDRLDPLVPEFIDRIPTDVISGTLPHYRREAPGRYALYSVGWNQVDDNGEPATTKSGNASDIQQGDWTWRFPAAQ